MWTVYYECTWGVKHDTSSHMPHLCAATHGSSSATNLSKTLLRPKNFSRKFPKEDSITHTSKNCAAANVGGRDVGDSNGDRGMGMVRYAGELRITDRTLRGRDGYLRSLDLV